MGNCIFKNFYVVDSYTAAIELYHANFTKEQVIADTWAIVGRSHNNPNEYPILNTIAFKAPRTNGFLARNIQIYNFESTMTMVLGMQMNNDMKTWVQGGKQSNYQNISYINCFSPQIVVWYGNPHNIVYDVDGTLTGNLVPTWLTPFNPALNIPTCTRHNNQ
jgi:phosphatidate phosphatase PAH1